MLNLKNIRAPRGLRSLTLLMAFLIPAISIQAMPPGASPDDGPPPTREQEERMLKRLQKHLDLSAEQTQKIQAIHDKYRGRVDALREKIEPLRKQLREKLMSETAKRSEVEQVMRKLADLRVEMQLVHFDRHAEVSAVLTPAQRAKMKEQMDKHMQKHMQKRDHHGPHGPADKDENDGD